MQLDYNNLEHFLIHLEDQESADAGIRRICSGWIHATGAAVVCLWLFNELVDRWQVVSINPEDYRPWTSDQSDGIVAFSDRIREPVLVTDLGSWTAQQNDVTYRAASSEIIEFGLNSLLSIPLISAPTEPSDAGSDSLRPMIRGVICCYFRGENNKAIDHQRLMLMGKVSAWTLRTVYESEQRTLLYHLNTLAAKFFAIRDGGPHRLREQYLTDLLDLLTSQLKLEHISIFYRSLAGTHIECLASTGIWDSSGVKVEKQNLRDAKYSIGEGVTGKVFETGQPVIRQDMGGQNEPVKFSELSPDEPSSIVPSLVLPIPLTSQESQGKVIVGVIRCSGTRLQSNPPLYKEFNSFQIQTLKFVAQQIGPILEMFTTSVERERVISIVKHDLFAPLAMMNDTIESLTRDNLLTGDYRLQDLSVASFFAKSMVEQLDFGTQSVTEPQPIPTMLQGDIISRLSAMLRHYADQSQGIRITFVGIRENIPRLMIDRRLIEQAFTNLLINAIKYGKPNSTIFVRGRRDPQGFYVDVENQGMGIDETDSSSIFSEGFRGRNARSKTQGLGIGLAVARLVMQRHGGQLLLRQRRDPTIFTLVFPKSLAFDY